MGKKFKIIRNPYGNQCIFGYNTITLKPGVTVLVGCNGCGKSTLLKLIKKQLDEEEMPYFTYDNLHDGGMNQRSKALCHKDYAFFSQAFSSSEGEEIVLNMTEVARKIGVLFRQKESEGATELYVLLDAIDSGMSVDNIIDVKELFDLILENRNNVEIYIIVSANEYEMCRGQQCLDVISGDYLTFADYEEYREFVIKSKTEKEKR